MKKCPFCAEMIQDEAVKCRFCGEFLDPRAGPVRSPVGQVEPPRAEQAKMAEIRRLQRIAGGQPTRADTLRKTKGLLFLVIIGCILLFTYKYRTRRPRAPSSPVSHSEISAISFEAFNALFGPGSTLSSREREREFANYKGKSVIWNGTVAYINRGPELRMSVRHLATTRTSDVFVRFSEQDRALLQDLREGEQVRYGGKIHDYPNEQNTFITLTDGIIFSVK